METERLKICTYTDESGQDTKGKTFVVCTIIIQSDKVSEIEKILSEIEKKSGKNKKWYHSGDKKRHAYLKLLVDNKVLNSVNIFSSEYKNKLDYINLIGSHIAKAIITFVGEEQYIAKIFIDKMDKKKILNLSKEIKSFHIRYKKIRGLADEADAFIRLADAVCGMIRDMGNKDIPRNYRHIFSKIKQV